MNRRVFWSSVLGATVGGLIGTLGTSAMLDLLARVLARPRRNPYA